MLYYIYSTFFLREIQIESQKNRMNLKANFILSSEILTKSEMEPHCGKGLFLVQQFYFAVEFFSGSKWIG